jgi:hypothetical protein
MPLEQITNSRAVERQALVELLRTVEPGATVNYGMMEAVARCDLRKNRHVLAAARGDLRDEETIVFEAVPTVGLRRLTEPERATVAPDRRRRKSFRQATLGLKEMRGLETAALSNSERQQFLGRLALLSAVAAVSSSRSLARVLSISAPDSPVLPLDQTLSELAKIK